MTIRTKIARWLDPELAARSDAADEAELRAFEMKGELQRANNTLAALRGDLSGLTNANDVFRDANIKLQLRSEEQRKSNTARGLTIIQLRAALQRALPYVLDAEDDLRDQLNKKLGTKRREAAEATLAAVSDDVKQINSALGVDSEDKA